jgi:hypothetical protein
VEDTIIWEKPDSRIRAVIFVILALFIVFASLHHHADQTAGPVGSVFAPMVFTHGNQRCVALSADAGPFATDGIDFALQKEGVLIGIMEAVTGYRDPFAGQQSNDAERHLPTGAGYLKQFLHFIEGQTCDREVLYLDFPHEITPL